VSAHLQGARALAAAYRGAVEALGYDWSGREGVLSLLAEFEESIQSLPVAEGRLAIAFVGPKNAGKSTLVASLAPAAAGRLPRGEGRAGATERAIWLAPERPPALEPASELWVRALPEELPDLGRPAALVDVPGLDEADEARRAAAERALRRSAVRVLVVRRKLLEARSAREALGRADGAVVLPVVNFCQLGGASLAEDVAAFAEDLRASLPYAREVLDPLVVPDFDKLPAGEIDDPAGWTRRALMGRLRAAGDAIHPERLARSRARFLTERLRERVASYVRGELPATADAVRALASAPRQVPARVVEDLFGDERAMRAGISSRLRGWLVHRTPGLFFPYRELLALINLAWGAVEKVPLVLMGSLPSFAATTRQALQNAGDAREFAERTRRGLSQNIEYAVQDQLRPRIRAFQAALAVERSRDGGVDLAAPPEVQIAGLGRLQAESSDLFREHIDRRAPGRAAAALAGLVGWLALWGVAVWPLVAVYREYGLAVRALLADGTVPLDAFPSETFSMMATGALLALAPVSLFAALSVAAMVGRGRIEACRAAILEDHRALVDRLVAEGALRVQVSDPRLEACLLLLGPGPRAVEARSPALLAGPTRGSP